VAAKTFSKLTRRSRELNHSDYRTVSPYWVLPVYVELIRAVWADDGDSLTGHYYFDEMRSFLCSKNSIFTKQTV
jgi:hypothetical protein